MNVSVQHMNFPALLYRVGNTKTNLGCWYDDEGRSTGIIHTLSDGPAKVLPMGWHPIFSSDYRRWISATDRLADIARWFSRRDMTELLERGYALEEIAVSSYRRFQFATYGHAVFCAEEVISRKMIEPWLPYEMRKAA
jgi:hypothetical protein